MKNKLRRLQAGIYMLTTIGFLSGCTDENLIRQEQQLVAREGKKVRVEIPFRISSYKQMATGTGNGTEAQGGVRGFTIVNEPFGGSDPQAGPVEPKELYNLWLFQFDASGNRVGTPQHISTIEHSVMELDKLDVELTVGSNQTLFLAVLGKKFQQDLSTISTVERLKGLYFNTFKSGNAGIEPIVLSDDDVPLSGMVKGVNIVPSLKTGMGSIEFNTSNDFDGRIDIGRVLAKVSFRFKFDVPEYEIKTVQLNNLPASFTLVPLAGKPTASLRSMAISSFPAPDEQGYCNFEWFVPQNSQGEVDVILSESDRFYNYTTNVGNAPKDGMYLQLWANHVTDPTFYSSYQIFLGKNLLTDFNIEANGHYFYTTQIDLPYSSGGDNDHRINGVYASNSIEGYASACYDMAAGKMITESKTFYDKYDFDCHYDSRPLYVNGEGCRVEVFLVDGYNNPIPEGTDTWLKISSFDNYTDAYQAGDLKTATSVDLIVPTRVKFTLYSDEYADPSKTEKREQRVCARSIANDGSSKVLSNVIFIYRQIPILDIGNFGGGLDIENGSFASRLGVDRINENVRYYDIPNPVYANNTYSRPFGYPGVFSLTSEENDMWYGKNATRVLAENPRNLKINTQGVEETKYIGGKPYLYQYNYHNTYGGRMCYDKNRDLNGNGVIDEEEMKWYLPAAFQLTMWWISGGGYDNRNFNITLYNEHGNGFYAANDYNIGTTYAVVLNNDDDKGGRSGGGIGSVKQSGSLICGYRCVRDLPMGGKNPSSRAGTEFVDGQKKPVISTTPEGGGEKRANSPSFYVNSPVYTYTFDGTGSKEENKPVQYEKRINRHTVKTSRTAYNPNYKVSDRFVVAKMDCPSDELRLVTSPIPALSPANPSRWAYLNGWTAEFNSYNANNLAPGTNAVRKGCSQYAENSDLSDKGKWRMPTQREMQLIALYEPVLQNTANETGFVSLTKTQSVPYATATEFETKAAAIHLYNNYLCNFDLNTKDNQSFKGRCIRDLD